MSSTELPGARFGDWISEGWKMFTEQWKAWVLELERRALNLSPTSRRRAPGGRLG